MIRSPAPIYTPPAEIRSTKLHTEFDSTGPQLQSRELDAGRVPPLQAKLTKSPNIHGRQAPVRGSVHELPAENGRVFELVGSPGYDDRILRNSRRARVYQHAAWSE